MNHLKLLCGALLSSAMSIIAAPDFSQVGFGASVTGGEGGTVVNVSSASEFKSACAGTDKKIIQLTGAISGASVSMGSNKTVIGIGSNAAISGSTISITSGSNIIFKNIKIHSQPKGADVFTILGGKNIWIDHCEIYSAKGDLNGDGTIDAEGDISGGDVDWFDGLIDMTEASQNITISWCVIHDAFKAMLVGKSDSDLEDRKITFHHNHFYNLRERGPSYRGGQGHVFNNYYSDIEYSAVNSRMGAKLRVEGNVFENVGSGEIDSKSKLAAGPIGWYYSSSTGLWDVNDNIFTTCKGNQPTQSTTSYTPPYEYANVLQPASEVKATVLAYAGVGKSTAILNNPSGRTVKVSNTASTPVMYTILGAKLPSTVSKRNANSVVIIRDEIGTRVDLTNCK